MLPLLSSSLQRHLNPIQSSALVDARQVEGVVNNLSPGGVQARSERKSFLLSPTRKSYTRE